MPIVIDEGFKLYRSKELLRVKGCFIDIITFQISQYGSKQFYVHYYKKILSYPLLDISSYSVGHRISDNYKCGDETNWTGLSEKEARKAIISVGDAYKKIIDPWFRSVNSVPEYVFEYFAIRHDASKTLELAIAFAEAGKREAAWWICSDILSEAIEEDEEVLAACQEYVDVHELEAVEMALNSNDYTEFRGAMKDYMVSKANHKTINSLLDCWKKKNIEKFKLEKFIV